MNADQESMIGKKQKSVARRKKCPIETKKHRLVLRRFFHSEAALRGGRVAVKKHPREGELLEGFPGRA